jgi:hypothetical protein
LYELGSTDIAVDEQGAVHILYMSTASPQAGVYYLKSLAEGQWSTPVRLSSEEWINTPSGRNINLVALFLSGGTLHASWVEPSSKTFYVRSQDQGESWTYPQLIPGSQQWISFGDMGSEKLGLFSIGVLPGIEDRCFKLQHYSMDNGTTWNSSVILQPDIKGCLGKINVLQDSLGRQHLVASAYRNLAIDSARIWYSYFGLRDWQVPTVILWPSTEYADLGEQPDFPSAVIASGNQLHIAFHVSEGRIWHTRCQLDAPPVEPIEFEPSAEPLESDAPSSAPPEGLAATPASNPVGAPGFQSELLTPAENTLSPITLSALFALVFISVASAAYLIRQKQRR